MDLRVLDLGAGSDAPGGGPAVGVVLAVCHYRHGQRWLWCAWTAVDRHGRGHGAVWVQRWLDGGTLGPMRAASTLRKVVNDFMLGAEGLPVDLRLCDGQDGIDALRLGVCDDGRFLAWAWPVLEALEPWTHRLALASPTLRLAMEGACAWPTSRAFRPAMGPVLRLLAALGVRRWALCYTCPTTRAGSGRLRSLPPTPTKMRALARAFAASAARPELEGCVWTTSPTLSPVSDAVQAAQRKARSLAAVLGAAAPAPAAGICVEPQVAWSSQ